MWRVAESHFLWYSALAILRDRLPAQAGLMVGHMWHTYILKSVGKRWYYVGSSNDIGRRIKEHNAGRVSSTKGHIPLELMYKKEFEHEYEARSYEKMLKDKRRAKEAIVREIEK